MASPDPDEHLEPATLVIETLAEPERARERLHRVVGLFDAADPFPRVCAAWMCCLLVARDDDGETVEYLVRRLTDRLDDEDVSLELTTTLDYISTRHSRQVQRVLAEIDDSRGVLLPEVGNFTRNHYYEAGPDPDDGRTRIAGRGDDGPRRTYADSGTDESTDEAADPADGREETENEGESTAEEDGIGGPMAHQRAELSSIAARSGFEDLHVLATRRRDRYADVYEALAARRGEERAVALRLLHRPEDDRPAFEERVEAALDRWNGIDDHRHVVSVFDWGIEPRPWLATTFTGDSLADVDQLPAERALEDATALANAVCHLHGNGVVHGGIDPQSVAYPEEVLGDDPVPVLDNVGLLTAFRFHFDPALCLDPRYAAPEYFDDSYGRVDHATDIYQLGAVLYDRLTGRPPFDGEFADVREAVLTGEPTPPSRIADVPPAVDDVLAKAMATSKLTRYETAEHFEQELASLGSKDG